MFFLRYIIKFCDLVFITNTLLNEYVIRSDVKFPRKHIEIFQKKKENNEKSLIDRISDSSASYVENSVF